MISLTIKLETCFGLFIYSLIFYINLFFLLILFINSLINSLIFIITILTYAFLTAQKMRRKLQIQSHLQQKPLMENFIFCAVTVLAFSAALIRQNSFVTLYVLNSYYQVKCFTALSRKREWAEIVVRGYDKNMKNFDLFVFHVHFVPADTKTSS